MEGTPNNLRNHAYMMDDEGNFVEKLTKENAALLSSKIIAWRFIHSCVTLGY